MRTVKESVAILVLLLFVVVYSNAQAINKTPSHSSGERIEEVTNPLSPDPAALFVVVVDGKYGFINRSGSVVISPQFDEAESFSKEGLAPASRDGKWGYINRKGDWVIPPKFSHSNGDFSEGLCAVNIGDLRDGKWGFMNMSGEIVVEAKYELVGPFSDCLAFVVLNGKRGFIDHSGKLIVPLKYDKALAFSEGLAAVEKNKQWGFIDTTGAEVIPLRYFHAAWFSDGLARVTKVSPDLKTAFIDKRGDEVFSVQGTAMPFSEGLAKASPDYKTWGFLDKKGQFAIKPRFQETESFSEGLAAVKLNNKWGYIDKKGEFVIKPQFDAADTFREGIALVGMGGTPRAMLPFGAKGYGNGQMGYIDRTGKYIWKPTQ